VILFGLLPFLCSERENAFFVLSPAIRFPERAKGVKGPKRQQSLAACRLSVACVSQRLDACARGGTMNSKTGFSSQFGA